MSLRRGGVWLAVGLLLAIPHAQAAQDPLAPPMTSNADGGTAASPRKRAAAPRRVAHRNVRLRPTVDAARRVPDVARPALAGIDVLAPAVRDYPRLAPEPRDDAAAFTPAFYLGGLARFVTQPPPPLECHPQRRSDIGRPGYVPGAPLYCAEVDP